MLVWTGVPATGPQFFLWVNDGAGGEGACGGVDVIQRARTGDG